jgi:hypothetical protein
MKQKTNPRIINRITSHMIKIPINIISKMATNLCFLFSFWVIRCYKSSSVTVFHPSLWNGDARYYDLHYAS